MLDTFIIDQFLMKKKKMRLMKSVEIDKGEIVEV